jgi:predicted permease
MNMPMICRDTRHAVRVLLASPAFTTTAVLTLALAIGANAAVFSIVDGVLLRPLPYRDPDRLALVVRTYRGSGVSGEGLAQNGRTWETIRDHARGFRPAVFSTWISGANIVANGTPSYVRQQRVGAGFFEVLGVSPVVGRGWSAEEDRPGGPAVVVLAHGLWRRLFDGDPSVVGRTIDLRGEPHTVIGVMPPEFQSGVRAELWTPLRPTTTGEGEGENYMLVVRLDRSTSWPEASEEAARLGREALPRRSDGIEASLSLMPLQRALAQEVRRPLLVLWAAVGVVLLIACVNLAGLQVARTSGRAREIATRLALGSGRGAVIRQLLVESLVIAVAGGLVGVVAGTLALDGLRRLAQDAFDLWQPVALDGRVIAVIALASIVAGVLFGIVPAVQATRLDVQAALVEGGARAVAGRASRWPRRLLVMAQVALGVVLLVAAGLLVRTFAHLHGLDPGFDHEHVITASVSLQDARYRSAERVTRLFDEGLARLGGVPGVESAAVSLGLPYERLLNLGFRRLDGPGASDRGSITNLTYVSPGYFRALRIPLRRGRSFTAADTAAAPGVAIVNDAFAQAYYKEEDPLGRRIGIAGREREIVGLAGDVLVSPGWGNHGPLAAMPLVYVPASQLSDAFFTLVHGWFPAAFIVRTSGPVEGLATSLRRAMDGVDPLLPFANVRTIADVENAALARQRFLMGIILALGGLAVVLAAIGIHGIIATSVTERTRELGIRMALGATIGQAMRSVALPGLVLALAGVGIGVALAAALVRLLRALLWGVSAIDPLTFAGASLLLVLVALVASVLPALRILRLDPAATLRHD